MSFNNILAKYLQPSKIPLKASLLIAALIFISNNSFTQETSSSISFYSTIIGNGKLLFTSELKKQTHSPAKINHISTSHPLIKKHRCNGIQLFTEKKTIVSLLQCEDHMSFLCPGELDNCENKNFTQTKKVKDTWERIGTLTDTKFTLEISTHSLVYRMLEKNCFIPYPHGCLIKGSGWHEYKRYEYISNEKG